MEDEESFEAGVEAGEDLYSKVRDTLEGLVDEMDAAAGDEGPTEEYVEEVEEF